MHLTNHAVGLVTLLALLLFAPNALAGSSSCGQRVNNTQKKIQECVTVEGVREHQAAFQTIADSNGGFRESGTSGHDASVDYVATRMENAGYDVSVQSFQFETFIRLGPSSLEQVSPGSVEYLENVEYEVVDQSDPGDVTAAVTAVDLDLGLGNRSTSGCTAADFAGFPVGNIALIQRGLCSLRVKAENAAVAGAVGAIIFNQGNNSGRFDVTPMTLTDFYAGGIPVFFARYDNGVEWSETPGLVMHMIANVFRGPATTFNVLAETPGGNPDNVIMVGAHLGNFDLSSYLAEMLRSFVRSAIRTKCASH